MIATRTVFVVSLLLQSAASLECWRIQTNKKFYNKFIQIRKSFLDYEVPPPVKLSEKDYALSALDQSMKSVCLYRDKELIKKMNELTQDEIIFNYAEDPYSRYQYFTTLKKVRMISFSSILVELTCPLLYQNQKTFRNTIKKVDEIVNGWNTNALRKNGPSKLFKPNEKQIKDLADNLAGAFNNVDCPSNRKLIEIIPEAIEEMYKIFENFAALEKLSGTDKQSNRSEGLKITENFGCYHSPTLDYIVSSPLNIPSLQQMRSICTEPLYDSGYTVKYKPLFFLRVLYPVFKLHEQDQVHCQLSPDTIVAANKSVSLFILIDFSDVALYEKKCTSQQLMAEKKVVYLTDLEKSKLKDVRDLGHTLMKVTLEQETLEEFGFQSDGNEIKFDDGAGANAFKEALRKRIESIDHRFNSPDLSKKIIVNDVLTILIALMAHPDPSVRPSVKKVLYFLLSVRSLASFKRDDYKNNRNYFRSKFHKFIRNEDFQLPKDTDWIKSVSDIIRRAMPKNELIGKTKGETKIIEVNLESEADLEEPEDHMEIEKEADRGMGYEENYIDLIDSVEEYSGPINQDWRFSNNENEGEPWPLDQENEDDRIFFGDNFREFLNGVQKINPRAISSDVNQQKSIPNFEELKASLEIEKEADRGIEVEENHLHLIDNAEEYSAPKNEDWRFSNDENDGEPWPIDEENDEAKNADQIFFGDHYEDFLNEAQQINPDFISLERSLQEGNIPSSEEWLLFTPPVFRSSFKNVDQPLSLQEREEHLLI